MPLETFGFALGTPLANSRAAWDERRGLLLDIEEGGFVGRGEASPLPGYSPETLEAARTALEAWEAHGVPVLDLEAPLLPQVLSTLGTIDPALPSARFAAETALLDLAGRRLGRPLWALLGAEAPAPVALAALIAARTPGEAVLEARSALERGIGTLKVKVGRPGAFGAELELLEALRRDLGSDFYLRLDANGAFTAENVAGRLAALARFEPELIEEPVSGAMLFELRDSPIPIAVDETLQLPGAWERLESLRRRGLLRAVVLKPMALGGSLACLELARSARGAGVAALVTHLFDGPVALAAAVHLALALPGERLACGLDRHPGLAAWPAADLPRVEAGTVSADPRPGLGLDRLGRLAG